MSDFDSRKYIARRVRGHDYDRYFATLFCPAELRPALHALYAFNLEIATIRESTSEPMIGRIRLQWWREAIGAVFDGRPPAHPVVTAVAEVTAVHGLARAPFERMIDGREAELSAELADDPATIERHAEATSSNLVGLALAVLGAVDVAAEKVALHGGLAWGLTGILRAAPFHSAGRNEIPPFGIWRAGNGDRRAAVRWIAESARRHLAAARSNAGGIPRRAFGAILPLAYVEPYLDRLSRAGDDPFDRAVALSRVTRQWRMTMSALRTRI